MPCSRTHILHVYLAERDIQKCKYDTRYKLNTPRTCKISYRLQYWYFRKQKVYYCSKNKGANKRPLFQEGNKFHFIQYNFITLKQSFYAFVQGQGKSKAEYQVLLNITMRCRLSSAKVTNIILTAIPPEDKS